MTGVPATRLITTQKSPITFSSEVPSGTGFLLLRAFTWTPTKRDASRLYAMMSTPRALRAVGITFQPSSDSL